MKHLISILISVILSIGYLSAQNNSDSFDPFKNSSISIGGGIFMPQGNLANYFGTAPFFEINANIPLKRKKAIGVSLQVVIPNQKDDFLYHRTIDTIQVKSTMMVNFIVDFKKTISSSVKGNFDVKMGVGISGITTDARNPFYSGEEGEKKYEMVSAMLFSPGLEYKYEFNDETKFVLGLSVHYAPYKVEGAVRENIGGLALVPKITYIF